MFRYLFGGSGAGAAGGAGGGEEREKKRRREDVPPGVTDLVNVAEDGAAKCEHARCVMRKREGLASLHCMTCGACLAEPSAQLKAAKVLKDPDRFCCVPDCVPASMHLRFAKIVLEDNKKLRLEALKLTEERDMRTEERDKAVSTFNTLDRLRAAEVAKRLEADERVAEMRQQLQRALAQAPMRELCPGCEQVQAMCMICTDEVAVWARTPCGHRTQCLGCHAKPQPPGFAKCELCRSVGTGFMRVW